MNANILREIPYNYTSAEDRQVLLQVISPELANQIEELRDRSVTGRSRKLLMRFLGELLLHQRNPFIYQEILDSARRRKRLFRTMSSDLDSIAQRSDGNKTVLDLLQNCRRLLQNFRDEIESAPEVRQRIRKTLGAIIGRENVCFDPFTLVSHATDATDWRLHLPIAVVFPTEEIQVAPLLVAISELSFKAIPRGGGTGLTGGAVPLEADCVIINTEKLNRIRGIEVCEFPHAHNGPRKSPVLALEAGVITEQAMEFAGEKSLVFATDPTSAWASTIGGNIAENAGGKTCVLWGTAVDNLLSWRVAMPSGQLWTVRRIGHSLRKILPEDQLRFEIHNDSGSLVNVVEIYGNQLRKNGLWKDITNKALGGLPGLQKEGTDGVITSAVFVLHAAYEHETTLCLEFFGPDMEEASQVILEISAAFPNNGQEALRALEHFDEQYVEAIQYRVKATRGETPKAVLLIDLVGHTPEEVQRGLCTMRSLLESHKNTEMFVAKDAADAKRFWQDRKKFGAIALRTNAFKLNEDVVLPLNQLEPFTRFVDEINIAEERINQISFLQSAIQSLRSIAPQEDPEWLTEKIPAATALCKQALVNLENHANHQELRSLVILRKLRRELYELLRGYPLVTEALEKAWKETRTRLLVLATHMHAGDGNVHVNIPILSNDRAMMERADQLVDQVMAKVMELGGVVSGEHGIGVTKLKYLEPERIAELDTYRQLVDPQGIMNPGKLRAGSTLDKLFTPSFNLLELEARILQHGSLEELATKIAHCVRCGRCKPDCCVFHPGKNLFYHPRNKNLAIGSLIEALLYDAQRERSSSFKLLKRLEDVADHCTICHKCQKPCPVNIDTGEVSVLERQILASRKFKHTALATQASLHYLGSRSPTFNGSFRALAKVGIHAQRVSSRLVAPLQRVKTLAELYPLRMLSSSLPPLHSRGMREYLPSELDQALVLEPPTNATGTVFYFPGCASERFFSRVSLAAIQVLLKLGLRVILPPPFLCCGYPAIVNARQEAHSRIVLRNMIVFSQIREMFSYLDFERCIVTCGTCREALGDLDAGKIFGCEVTDLSRFAFDKGMRVEGKKSCLYHAPCHDSLDGKAAEIFHTIGGYQLNRIPHCCSEAGTMAMSRPDISSAMLQRKTSALSQVVEEMALDEPLLLTNCPGCLMGLGRQRLSLNVRHTAEELATALCGEVWIDELQLAASRAERVRF